MSDQTQPFVSVVTPVYNTEKYLPECIESVLAQSYTNWEYIIVDNCSTDRSREIAEDYARRDSRIRVHRNETFLKQLPNWNHALRQISAQSQYCKVLHADDWLYPACISSMVELAEAHPSVGVVGAYRLDETEVNLSGLPYPSTMVRGREMARAALLGGLHVFGSPSSLLICADLVRKRDSFYDESTIGADTLVCFDLLQESDFGFVHQVLTFTRRHNESLSSMTHRFNLPRLGRLIALKRYGRVFLEEREYNLRLKKQLRSYYGYFAKSVFELREKAFWDYHRAEFEKLGHPISRLKLSSAVFLEFFNLRENFRRVQIGLRRNGNGDGAQDWRSAIGSIRATDAVNGHHQD